MEIAKVVGPAGNGEVVGTVRTVEEVDEGNGGEGEEVGAPGEVFFEVGGAGYWHEGKWGRLEGLGTELWGVRTCDCSTWS